MNRKNPHIKTWFLRFSLLFFSKQLLFHKLLSENSHSGVSYKLVSFMRVLTVL